jgi:ABC-type glutathione transport system ATPase component
MVEHDMGVVFNLADRISVLVYGEVIATGTPQEIRANKAVQEAYLGTESDRTGSDRTGSNGTGSGTTGPEGVVDETARRG